MTEKNYNSIPAPINVRWNSELKTIRAICEIRLSDLNSALAQAGLTNLCLTADERNKLIDLVNILEPFEFITDLLQGDIFILNLILCFLDCRLYTC